MAFAVFIAAGAFAWQALRPVTRPETAQGPIDGSILWPERTAAALASTAVAGRQRRSERRVAVLDPKRWQPDSRWTCSGGVCTVPGYVVSVADNGAGAATATLTPRPDMCPSPPSGSTPVCPLPSSEELLTLRQAGGTGDTGVWSVTEARASGLDLRLAPGAVVPNGGTIGARSAASDEWRRSSRIRGVCRLGGGAGVSVRRARAARPVPS